MYELLTDYTGEAILSVQASFAVRSTGVFRMKFLAFLASAALVASPAFANSFQNGGFENLTNGTGQLDYPGFTHATGWQVSGGDGNGYIFAFAPGSGDTSGSVGQYGGLSMWGTNNGGNSVLPATSPSGGNFLAMDGAYKVQSLDQVITGLTIGKTYSVGFDYGFAQQAGFDGPTEQNVSVSFAGVTHNAEATNYSLGSHNFSGWFHTSVDFVATSATDTLSFLAYGDKPVPPFALLDGVTFTPDTVPEPATWAMLLTGFGAVGFAARRRRSGVVAA